MTPLCHLDFNPGVIAADRWTRGHHTKHEEAAQSCFTTLTIDFQSRWAHGEHYSHTHFVYQNIALSFLGFHSGLVAHSLQDEADCQRMSRLKLLSPR